MNFISSQRKFLVIGEHVTHSLSPHLHNSLFYRHHIPLSYDFKNIHHLSEIKQVIQDLKEGILWGINVTAPFKSEIIHYLDDIDPHALLIDSVNTVVRRTNGRLYGSSTDGLGFFKSAEKYFASSNHHTVWALGAGGAIRAILSAWLTRSSLHLIVLNRHQKKLDHLKKILGTIYDSLDTPFKIKSKIEMSFYVCDLLNSRHVHSSSKEIISETFKNMPANLVIVQGIPITPDQDEILFLNLKQLLDNLKKLKSQLSSTLSSALNVIFFDLRYQNNLPFDLQGQDWESLAPTTILCQKLQKTGIECHDGLLYLENQAKLSFEFFLQTAKDHLAL